MSPDSSFQENLNLLYECEVLLATHDLSIRPLYEYYETQETNAFELLDVLPILK